MKITSGVLFLALTLLSAPDWQQELMMEDLYEQDPALAEEVWHAADELTFEYTIDPFSESASRVVDQSCSMGWDYQALTRNR